VRRVEHDGQRHPQPGGQRDRRQRDRGGDPPPAPDQPQVHLEPDDEHEQHEPELGDDREVRPDVGGEQHLRQVAWQQPQHARAEHDAAQDLADDGGLAQPHEQPAHEPGDDDDDRDVEEDERQYVLGHAAPSRLFPTGAG
jgi:hypothetical protein